MAHQPTTQRIMANAAESAYASRQQRCATPRCRNLPALCCGGYCWTCSAMRNTAHHGYRELGRVDIQSRRRNEFLDKADHRGT